jgi:hypothetical protein
LENPSAQKVRRGKFNRIVLAGLLVGMTLAPLSPARSADTPAQDCDEATASDAGAYQTCLKLLREELEALVIEAETWVVIVARRLDKADNGLRTNRIGAARRSFQYFRVDECAGVFEFNAPGARASALFALCNIQLLRQRLDQLKDFY